MRRGSFRRATMHVTAHSMKPGGNAGSRCLSIWDRQVTRRCLCQAHCGVVGTHGVAVGCGAERDEDTTRSGGVGLGGKPPASRKLVKVDEIECFACIMGGVPGGVAECMGMVQAAEQGTCGTYHRVCFADTLAQS